MPGRSIPFYKAKGSKNIALHLQCAIFDVQLEVEDSPLKIGNQNHFFFLKYKSITTAMASITPHITK